MNYHNKSSRNQDMTSDRKGMSYFFLFGILFLFIIMVYQYNIDNQIGNPIQDWVNSRHYQIFMHDITGGAVVVGVLAVAVCFLSVFSFIIKAVPSLVGIIFKSKK